MYLLQTYPFLIPLLVGLLSECTKFAIDTYRAGSLHVRLFHAGGMPSTHSAFVTSLLIIVHRRAGLESVEFAIAFVFACLVWYDAMSSRRALGEQAAILNTLQKRKHLTEQLGHSFIQVVGGVVFGAVVTGFGIWMS